MAPGGGQDIDNAYPSNADLGYKGVVIEGMGAGHVHYRETVGKSNEGGAPRGANLTLGFTLKGD